MTGTMTCQNLLDDNDKLDAHSIVSIEEYNENFLEEDGSNEKSTHVPNAPNVSQVDKESMMLRMTGTQINQQEEFLKERNTDLYKIPVKYLYWYFNRHF